VEHLLVAGLGNHGRAYRNTRHNVGFTVLDELCKRWSCSLREGRGDYYRAEASHGETTVVLIAPTTFMNNSGIAVREVAEEYTLPPGRVLVVADDFALPLGMLRLRRSGSDGGHNGLASIIYHLNSAEFPRLRCGIGSVRPFEGEDPAAFVLSPFAPEESQSVAAMVERAAEAVESFVHSGIDRTMTQYNRTP
jgi:peptidyl-tRNA hydrolase, PTH1 family